MLGRLQRVWGCSGGAKSFFFFSSAFCRRDFGLGQAAGHPGRGGAAVSGGRWAGGRDPPDPWTPRIARRERQPPRAAPPRPFPAGAPFRASRQGAVDEVGRRKGRRRRRQQPTHTFRAKMAQARARAARSMSRVRAPGPAAPTPPPPRRPRRPRGPPGAPARGRRREPPRGTTAMGAPARAGRRGGAGGPVPRPRPPAVSRPCRIAPPPGAPAGPPEGGDEGHAARRRGSGECGGLTRMMMRAAGAPTPSPGALRLVCRSPPAPGRRRPWPAAPWCAGRRPRTRSWSP